MSTIEKRLRDALQRIADPNGGDYKMWKREQDACSLDSGFQDWLVSIAEEALAETAGAEGPRCPHGVFKTHQCRDCENEVTAEEAAAWMLTQSPQPAAEGTSGDRTVLMRFMDAADRAFQGSGSILPDFLRLGDCKAEGIVKLAEAYRALLVAYDQRHHEPQPAAGPEAGTTEMSPAPMGTERHAYNRKLPWGICAGTAEEDGAPYVGLFYKGGEVARFGQGYDAREACIALNEKWKREHGRVPAVQPAAVTDAMVEAALNTFSDHTRDQQGTIHDPHAAMRAALEAVRAGKGRGE